MTGLEPAQMVAADGGAPVVGESARLLASQCPNCGRTEFPAREQCPACGEPSTTAPLPSEGRLCGFTAVLHPPPGTEVPVPYGIGVVEFDGRVRVMGLLTQQIDGLDVDPRVRTVTLHPAADVVTYGFQPL